MKHFNTIFKAASDASQRAAQRNALYQLIDAFLFNEFTKRERRYIEKMASSQSEKRRAKRYLAIVLNAYLRPEKALPNEAAIIQGEPLAHFARLVRVYQKLEQKRFHEAREALTAFNRSHGSFAFAWYLQARLIERTGNALDADYGGDGLASPALIRMGVSKCLSSATNQQGNFQRALVEFASVSIKLELFEVADRLYRKLRKVHASPTRYASDYAIFLEKVGRFDEALAYRIMSSQLGNQQDKQQLQTYFRKQQQLSQNQLLLKAIFMKSCGVNHALSDFVKEYRRLGVQLETALFMHWLYKEANLLGPHELKHLASQLIKSCSGPDKLFPLKPELFQAQMHYLQVLHCEERSTVISDPSARVEFVEKFLGHCESICLKNLSHCYVAFPVEWLKGLLDAIDIAENQLEEHGDDEMVASLRDRLGQCFDSFEEWHENHIDNCIPMDSGEPKHAKPYLQAAFFGESVPSEEVPDDSSEDEARNPRISSLTD